MKKVIQKKILLKKNKKMNSQINQIKNNIINDNYNLPNDTNE